MKKKLFFLIAILCVLLSASACGKDPTEDQVKRNDDIAVMPKEEKPVKESQTKPNQEQTIAPKTPNVADHSATTPSPSPKTNIETNNDETTQLLQKLQKVKEQDSVLEQKKDELEAQYRMGKLDQSSFKTQKEALEKEEDQLEAEEDKLEDQLEKLGWDD